MCVRACVLQMCVSTCPDRFSTFSEMQLQHRLDRSQWDYFRQFCKPGFNHPDKVPALIREEPSNNCCISDMKCVLLQRNDLCCCSLTCDSVSVTSSSRCLRSCETRTVPLWSFPVDRVRGEKKNSISAQTIKNSPDVLCNKRNDWLAMKHFSL